MHAMAQLVGEGHHIADFALVIHQNIGMGAGHRGVGKGAGAFAWAGLGVNPIVGEKAAGDIGQVG